MENQGVYMSAFIALSVVLTFLYAIAFDKKMLVTLVFLLFLYVGICILIDTCFGD